MQFISLLSQGNNTSTITDSIFDSFSRYKLCTLSGIQCLTLLLYLPLGDNR